VRARFAALIPVLWLVQALALAIGLTLPATALAQFTPQPVPGTCPTERPAAHDLRTHEGRPPLGHTLARHVGLSDADLHARLEREPRIAAASTFTDLSTAQCVVDRALADTGNQRRIERWRAAPDDRTLVLRYRGREVVGRILPRGGRPKPAIEATIVLRKIDGRPFLILTAYPDD